MCSDWSVPSSMDTFTAEGTWGLVTAELLGVIPLTVRTGGSEHYVDMLGRGLVISLSPQESSELLK